MNRVFSTFILILFLNLSLSCGGGAGREALPAETDAVTHVAAPVAKQLLSSLKKELLGAMDAGGPAGALQYCNTRALPLTEEIAAQREGWSLKRVSDRLRAPANQPDQAEQAALDFFLLKNRAEARVPDYWVQDLKRGGERFFRYYQPLRIAAPCLNCHGTKEQMQPAVLEALRELYPADNALNYHEGDFRGLLRIEIPANTIKEH